MWEFCSKVVFFSLVGLWDGDTTPPGWFFWMTVRPGQGGLDLKKSVGQQLPGTGLNPCPGVGEEGGQCLGQPLGSGLARPNKKKKEQSAAATSRPQRALSGREERSGMPGMPGMDARSPCPGCPLPLAGVFTPPAPIQFPLSGVAPGLE